MKFNAKQIAEILGGECQGDSQAQVERIERIEDATPGSLTFLANPQYTPFIYSTQASIVIVNKSFVPENPIKATLIRVDDAYQAFAKVLSFYDQIKKSKTGIEERVHIHPTAKIGKDVFIGSFTYIGENTVIGDGVKIHQHCYIGNDVIIGNNTHVNQGVKILDMCLVGNNVTLHAGVIIGSEGFGFAPKGTEGYNKVPQIGNVVIHDEVEIGANTTIDRATLGSTVIYKGVKLDNLIQIAHNVEIGENTVMAAQCGVAGSTKIGKNCMIGGQVGIAGHLNIGDGVKIAAQSGLTKSVKAGEIIMGSPAQPISEFRKSFILLRQLPKLIADLKKNDI